MPVLMNKGNDPRQAAWLFYTDRATLDAFGATAASERFDAGALTVDDADLDAAPKPSSEVPVYLAVATLVPADFDLAGLMDEAAQQGEGIIGENEENVEENEGDVEANVEESSSGEEGPGIPGANDGGAEGPASEDVDGASADPAGEDSADALPYTPVPAPEGTRILVGTTTAAAARAYIQPREVDGKPWATELPGLPMLVSLIDHMREHGGLPPYAIWHIDAQGILRMAPAKQVKPMAGNVLKCKR